MHIAPAVLVGFALATAVSVDEATAALPAPSQAAIAAADEAKAKAAWSDKVGAYQLCLATDRIAATYRRGLQTSGKPAPAAVATPACADPGPYVAAVTPVAAKPIEASEAHSPPGTATSPPSTNATAAELQGTKKK